MCSFSPIDRYPPKRLDFFCCSISQKVGSQDTRHVSPLMSVLCHGVEESERWISLRYNAVNQRGIGWVQNEWISIEHVEKQAELSLLIVRDAYFSCSEEERERDRDEWVAWIIMKTYQDQALDHQPIVQQNEGWSLFWYHKWLLAFRATRERILSYSLTCPSPPIPGKTQIHVLENCTELLPSVRFHPSASLMIHSRMTRLDSRLWRSITSIRQQVTESDLILLHRTRQNHGDQRWSVRVSNWFELDATAWNFANLLIDQRASMEGLGCLTTLPDNATAGGGCVEDVSVWFWSSI